MARFEKGHAKLGGRKPGVSNKTTGEIKKAIQQVLSMRITQLEDDLNDMDPFKRWTILNSVAKYVLPTLNKNQDSVEHSGGVNVTISFEDTNNQFIDLKNEDDE